MKLLTYITAWIQLQATYASPLAKAKRNKPPFFLLAGDSTTAINGGWGDGFLETTLAPPAAGINHGHSGATTVSFRSGGDWSTVLSQIATHRPHASTVYVTIQFGHNDQKPTANISAAQFRSNLSRFVTDVLSAGGQPLLITSLTRRVFSSSSSSSESSPPRVVPSLANERNATVAVAEERGVRWIDLNRASEAYCNSIGPQASYGYNSVNATRQGDTTHLNEWGGVVFGRLVSDLLNEKYADEFEPWTVKNETLSRLLKEGIAA